MTQTPRYVAGDWFLLLRIHHPKNNTIGLFRSAEILNEKSKLQLLVSYHTDTDCSMSSACRARYFPVSMGKALVEDTPAFDDLATKFDSRRIYPHLLARWRRPGLCSGPHHQGSCRASDPTGVVTLPPIPDRLATPQGIFTTKPRHKAESSPRHAHSTAG